MLRNLSTTAILLTALATASPAIAAPCFHSNGTCYAVLGSAQAASPDNGGFAYYDNQLSGYVERTFQANQASSSVNLQDASIKLLADASVPGTGASATGKWIESVKFDLPDGVQSLTIPILVHLDGINTQRAFASYNNISLTFQMSSYQFSSINAGHFDSFSLSKYCGFDAEFTSSICHGGNVAADYIGEITIWEDVFYQIEMGVGLGGTNIRQDFTNTAKFSWELPAGVTYVSGSGSFLTAAPAGIVPEPATWTMLIVGFGAMGGAMRRRSSLTASGQQYRSLV